MENLSKVELSDLRTEIKREVRQSVIRKHVNPNTLRLITVILSKSSRGRSTVNLTFLLKNPKSAPINNIAQGESELDTVSDAFDGVVSHLKRTADTLKKRAQRICYLATATTVAERVCAEEFVPVFEG